MLHSTVRLSQTVVSSIWPQRCSLGITRDIDSKPDLAHSLEVGNPSKVKIFIWRALHGILPLKSILANTHVGTSGECTICHIGAEDIHHLLFTCETAHEIWRQLGLSQVMEDAQSVDKAGSVVLEHLLRL
jgi:hypothetical protein